MPGWRVAAAGSADDAAAAAAAATEALQLRISSRDRRGRPSMATFHKRLAEAFTGRPVAPLPPPQRNSAALIDMHTLSRSRRARNERGRRFY